MDKFLNATGTRKVAIGAYYFTGICILVAMGAITESVFQNVALILIAGFFGGNVMEHRTKTEKCKEPDKDPPAPADK